MTTLRLTGRILESSEFGPVDIGNPIDWSLDPFDHPSWRFRFHALRWTLPLLEQIDTHTAELPAESILRQWIQSNPVDNPPSDYSWSDHTTALRTHVFVGAAERLGRPDWLMESLQTHGATLVRPDFYRGEGNHALDQSIALHEVAVMLGRPDWMAIAENRINVLALASIDDQGVINEGAVSYQAYNYSRYGEAIAQLQRVGRSAAPEVLHRWALMPKLLAHATRPDRYYEQIGDTYLSRPKSAKGTIAEFAATQGRTGPRPDRRVAIFDAGFIFGRSGWGEHRSFDTEDFYSVRFGSGAAWRFHAHSDHTSVTWHPHGTPTIIDAGFSGHERTPYRRYTKGPEGHNVVVVREVKHTPTASTRLVESRIDDGSASYSLASDTYPGVSRNRRIFVAHDPAVLIVLDELTGPRRPITWRRPITCDQIWHFHPGLTVQLGADTVVASKSNFTVRISQVLGGSMHVVAGETDPCQGWASFQAAHRVPAPAVVTTKAGKTVRFLTVIALCSELSTQLDGDVLRTRVDDVDLSVSVRGPLILGV